jgi:hypothetical protein
MNNFKTTLITWIGLLAVCLLPMELPAAGHHPSGVIGQVDKPAGFVSTWIVAVSSDSGTFIEFVPTDEDGFFAVDLRPGKYVLTPQLAPPAPGQPIPNIVMISPSTKVTVKRNHFSFVELPTSDDVPLTPPLGRYRN